MRSLRFSLVVLAVLLLLPDLGEGRRRGGRRGRGKAARAFAEGTRLFKSRDYIGAAEAFQRAYKLKPHFLVQCNIARCFERMNDMIKAAKHFRRCLEEGADRTRAKRKVRRSLKRVEDRISHVMIRTKGRRQGTVFLDGLEMGQTPLRLSLNPGKRVIEVRREGATPASTTLFTRGGESRTIRLTPTPVRRRRPRPPPDGDGLDGDTGSGAGGARSRGLSQVWFWSTAALTVALATVSTVLGVRALNAKSSYEETPTRDGYNAAKDRRLLANIFWGATALSGIASTTVFFFTDFGGGGGRERDASAPRVLGVGVAGTW